MQMLPFETGYLSTMSEHELLDLAAELEHNQAFWANEDTIGRIVDRYIARHWRRSSYASYARYSAGFSVLTDPYVSDSVLRMQASRTINVNVPDALDERTARLFVEMQVREQMDPRYDPTQNDV